MIIHTQNTTHQNLQKLYMYLHKTGTQRILKACAEDPAAQEDNTFGKLYYTWLGLTVGSARAHLKQAKNTQAENLLRQLHIQFCSLPHTPTELRDIYESTANFAFTNQHIPRKKAVILLGNYLRATPKRLAWYARWLVFIK